MEMAERIHRLERQVRRQRLVLGGLALLGAGAAISGFTRPPADLIETHAIRILDAQGRPRLLLGAPPPPQGRVRQDAQTASLVVLGPDGRDRLVLGEMPGPEVNGKGGHRISTGYGLVLHDPRGSERGGVGFLDQAGRAIVALDRPNADAIALMVDDKSGWAGVSGFYPGAAGQYDEAFRLGSQGNVAALTLRDHKGERARLAVDGAAPPKLETQAAQ